MVAVFAHDSIVETVVDRGSDIGKIDEPDENVLLWFFAIFSVLGIAIVMA
ncbi:MAG: hypothetical protein IPM23_18625 [Candidatus Melainabacteria bacterium]|nr:hypothetical protein [Candidatus Melainabacteria bacterium]